jgi:HSP20 family protein
MFGLIPWKRGDRNRGEVVRREDPLASFYQEFDSLFDRFFGRGPLAWRDDEDRLAAWGLELEDTAKEYVLHAEAPGFEMSDFDIQITGDVLTIQAEHKQEPKEGEQGQPVRERWFQKQLRLPAGIEADKVEARYHNGILELHLPRTPEALGRKIEVKA